MWLEVAGAQGGQGVRVVVEGLQQGCFGVDESKVAGSRVLALLCGCQETWSQLPPRPSQTLGCAFIPHCFLWWFSNYHL